MSDLSIQLGKRPVPAMWCWMQRLKRQSSNYLQWCSPDSITWSWHSREPSSTNWKVSTAANTSSEFTVFDSLQISNWQVLYSVLMEKNDTVVWPSLSLQARRIIDYHYTTYFNKNLLYLQMPDVHSLAGMSLLSKLLLILHWLCPKIVWLSATW